VRVWNFRKPSERELAHDYLWRVHARTPGDGMISVFNRSHYEDVLVVRVHDLVPKERWSRRYDHINAFEQLLVDEGTRILKIYLHITPEYQRERLQRRLDRPDKHWKFNPSDLSERRLWKDYRTAYETAFSRCSTEAAPWYVVPAEARWFRTVLVASLVERELERMAPAYPEPDFDPSTIIIEPLP
jgi:PPK2 family polyphosphate:nucleotide phosphotransferase